MDVITKTEEKYHLLNEIPFNCVERFTKIEVLRYPWYTLIEKDLLADWSPENDCFLRLTLRFPVFRLFILYPWYILKLCLR